MTWNTWHLKEIAETTTSIFGVLLADFPVLGRPGHTQHAKMRQVFSHFFSMEVHFDHEKKKNRGLHQKKTIVVGFGKFNDPNWGHSVGDDDFFCRLFFSMVFFFCVRTKSEEDKLRNMH